MIQCRIARSRLLCAVLGLAILWLGAETIRAQLPGPSATDRKVAVNVKQRLERDHLTHRKVDDEVSRRFFKTFLDEFDRTRVYFEQSDIDEFKKHETTLDDEISQGDLEFAYQVLQRFLARMRERLPLIEELIEAPHDFSADEDFSTDFDNMGWPRTAEELRERWRKRVKNDLLMLRLDKKPLPEPEQKQRIAKRYRNILKRYEQMDSNELLEAYLNALTTSFDPHTSYMSATTLEDFNIQMRLSLDGIGARLKSEDGYTIVAEVVPGGAADKDGRLKIEDKIVGVGQSQDKIEDVVDMKLTDVVKKIRGPRSTPVVLRVIPAGKTESVDYKLMRAKIELTEQEAWSQILESGKKEDGKPYRLGYINLPSFYRDVLAEQSGKPDFKSSTRDVLRELRSFREADGVDGVILDLRGNGGGALKEAIDLVGLFIDKGTVVQVKAAGDQVEQYEKDENDSQVAYAGPLVVLVNKLSASASEIFAGAIQDYGRGLIVGDSSTHGKGTVQQVVDVLRPGGFGGSRGSLGALKLTIQQFYRVNGESTQRQGVRSDVVLPDLWDHMEVGEASLPHSLPFSRVAPVEHAQLGRVTPELAVQLQGLSDQRRENSTEFRKLLERIDRFEADKQRKAISLNEQKRRQQKSGGDEEDPSAEPDQPKKREKTLERNFYNDEVLHVTEDFLRLGHHPKVASKL